MQDEDGQILEAHSISAGLDYPGTGPQHACAARHRPRALRRGHRRARRSPRSRALAALEGIIPALESAHALAWVLGRAAGDRRRSTSSASPGRGDKDLAEVARPAREPTRRPGRAIAAAFAAHRRRAALMPYLMGGFPDLEASRPDRRGLRRRRRRPGRARRPVLRPAGRRPGDPRRRHRARWPPARPSHAVLEVGARDRRARPGRAHVSTRTSVLAPRRRALRDRAGRPRHQRADRARPAARGGRRACARPATRAGRRAGAARRADDARRAPARRSARRRAASSTRSRSPARPASARACRPASPSCSRA